MMPFITLFITRSNQHFQVPVPATGASTPMDSGHRSTLLATSRDRSNRVTVLNIVSEVIDVTDLAVVRGSTGVTVEYT